MLLSELKAQLDKESKKAKRAGVDPEVRFLILPNFPTALSIRTELVSSLDSSLSKSCREQGSFIYLAEDKDEGPVFGEITERFGWQAKSKWNITPTPSKSDKPDKPSKAKKPRKNKSILQLQDIVESEDDNGDNDAR